MSEEQTPEEESIEENLPAPEQDAAPKGKISRNAVVGIAGGLVAVILCCCVVLAAILVIDPFAWNVLQRLNGTYDAAADSVPADVPVYMGVDLLAMAEPDAQRILKLFAGLNDPAEPDADPFNQLDESLSDDYSLNFTEDIRPWMSRYAGIAILKVGVNQAGEPEPEQVALLLTATNKQAAAAFVAKYLAGLQEKTGQSGVTENYNGVDIHSVDAPSDSDDAAVALSGNMVILANNADAIKTVLDTPSGSSLMDSKAYQNSLASLPNKPAVVFHVSMDFYRDLVEQMSQGNPVAANPAIFDQLKGTTVLMGVSFNSAGIAFDTVMAMADEELYQQAVDNYQQLAANETGMVTRFPAETYVYLQSVMLEGAIQKSLDQMQDVPEMQDFEESITLLEEQLGFHLVNDMLIYFQGELAMGMVAANDGFLVETEEVNVGILFMAELSESEPVIVSVDKINDLVQQQFFLPPTAVEVNGQDIFVVGDPFSGLELLAYGVVDSYFTLGTSAASVQDLFDGGDSLAQNANYAELWGHFPKGSVPVFYVDIESLVTIFSGDFVQGGPGNPYEPFLRFGAAVLAPEDGFARSSMLLRIENPE